MVVEIFIYYYGLAIDFFSEVRGTSLPESLPILLQFLSHDVTLEREEHKHGISRLLIDHDCSIFLTSPYIFIGPLFLYDPITILYIHLFFGGRKNTGNVVIVCHLQYLHTARPLHQPGNDSILIWFVYSRTNYQSRAIQR